MRPEHRLSVVTDETGSRVTLHTDLNGLDLLLGELRRLSLDPNQPSNRTQYYF